MNMTKQNKSELTILIIDDSSLDRERAIHALSRGLQVQHRCHEAVDIASAFHLIDSYEFDCIILDHLLPDGDSSCILQELKQRDASIPVIITTGHDDQDIILNAWRNGAHDYINKSDISKISLPKATLKAIQISRLEREKDEAIDELRSFAGMVAHDLKTPLSQITGLCELIKDEEQNLSESVKPLLTMVFQSCERMIQLISDLLEYSTIEKRGKEFEACSLDKIVETVLGTFSQTLRQHDATVELKSLGSVEGRPAQLTQLFQNLIENSLKYRKHMVSPRMIISSQNIDELWIEITLEDNGIGFDQKDAQIIFYPLSRLKKSQETQEGSGIGLATCKRIVSQHNGTIRAESKSGVGTKIVIKLPRTQDEVKKIDPEQRNSHSLL